MGMAGNVVTNLAVKISSLCDVTRSTDLSISARMLTPFFSRVNKELFTFLWSFFFISIKLELDCCYLHDIWVAIFHVNELFVASVNVYRLTYINNYTYLQIIC